MWFMLKCYITTTEYIEPQSHGGTEEHRDIIINVEC